MPTLEEILDNDLGLGTGVEKTASQVEPETDEIEKLAMDLGLSDNNENNNLSDEHGHKKEAQMTENLNSLYNELFPGDAETFGGQEKVAEINKEAAVQEAMGEFAREIFEEVVDSEVEKIAEQLVSADGSTEAHPQLMDNNEDTTEDAIDTKPDNSDAEKAMGTSPEGAVGNFESHPAPTGTEKTASEEAEELFNIGFGVYAQQTVEAIEKNAAEAKEDDEEKGEEEPKAEDKLEEGQKKEAAAKGAFLAQGYIQGLMKQGEENHNDPLAYLYDAIDEKIEKIAGGKAEAVKRVAKKVVETAKKHPVKTNIAAGVAATAGLGGLASTKAGKRSSESRAKGLAENAAGAKANRKKNMGQYLLNPMAAGPLTEASSRLGRRANASMAEHPLRTAMIPGYGIIRGGKAGKDKLK